MERPIIFSTEMVKAILEGRKTQTRRVISHFSVSNSDIKEFQEFRYVPHSDIKWEPPEGYYALLKCNANQDYGTIYYKCPYGQAGDKLWVRETWATIPEYDAWKPSEIPNTQKVYYKDYELLSENITCGWVGKWRPSIHMPRWASRINLEILKVRVERLQDISEEDAQAEGAELTEGIRIYPQVKEFEHLSDHIFGFINLWDSINGKKHPWESNPWVWVIEFKKE